MSENIPESIPTSSDPRSKRPTKRRALSPTSATASQISALMADPEREIQLPSARTQKPLAPPPEIVANVQGSSAGAGSGEFHVYKASRRREYERIGRMEAEVKEEREKAEWERKVDEMKKKDEEKTKRNAEKRAKAKARKNKGGKGGGEPTKGVMNGGGAANGKHNHRTEGSDRAVGEAGTSNGTESEAAEDAIVTDPDEIGVIIHDDD